VRENTEVTYRGKFREFFLQKKIPRNFSIREQTECTWGLGSRNASDIFGNASDIFGNASDNFVRTYICLANGNASDNFVRTYICLANGNASDNFVRTYICKDQQSMYMRKEHVYEETGFILVEKKRT
jgi:hypothetical protein